MTNESNMIIDESELITSTIQLYNSGNDKLVYTLVDSITYQEFYIQNLWELNIIYFDTSIKSYRTYFNIDRECHQLIQYDIKDTRLTRWWSFCKCQRLFHWIWFNNSIRITLQLFSEEEIFSDRLLMIIFEDERYIKFIDMNTNDSYAQLAEYNLHINNYEYIVNQLEYCRNQRLVLNKLSEYMEQTSN